MTLRKIREANGLRLEDMALMLKMPINDLCDLEMASTKYHALLAEFVGEIDTQQSPK